jgi:quercetin dioxygenase-like cupin family protein
MKAPTHRITGLLLAIVASLVTTKSAAAQDAAKVASGNYTVIFENDRVRVLDYHSKPGDTAAMHSHQTHLAYFLSAGKATFTAPDGQATQAEGKAGDVLWLPPATHAVTNAGTTELHVLVIEFKE